MRLRSYGELSIDELHNSFTEYPPYAAMNWRSRARLCVVLLRSRILYDLRENQDRAVKPGAIAAKIDGLLLSIRRIADFASSFHTGKDAASSAALLAIAGQAEVWAKHYQGDLPIQFRPSTIVFENGTTEIDYGSSEVINSFFNAASSIYRIAVDAENALREHRSEVNDQHSAIVWLAGSSLPELYEKMIGAFTTRLNDDGTTPGIEFVRLALRSIGKEALSPETIRSHYKKAKRVTAPEISPVASPGTNAG